MQLRIPAPIEVEIGWKKAEERATNKLARSTGLISIFAAAAMLCLLVEAAYASWDLAPHFFPQGAGGVLDSIHYEVLALIAISPFIIFVRDEWRLLAMALSTMLIWGFSALVLFGNVSSMPLRFLLYVNLPLLTFVGWIYLTQTHTRRARVWGAVLYSGFFWAMFLATLIPVSRLTTDFELNIFWHYKPVMIWLSVLSVGLAYTYTWREAAVFLSPANCLHGCLWPEGSRLADVDTEQRKKLWWNGAARMVIGYAAVALRAQTEVWFSLTAPYSVARMACTVLLPLLMVSGYLNILTGSFRMFGYQARDATDFAALAVSPADYFRRRAVFNLLFNVRFIYFPMLRWTRAPLLATGAALFGLFLYKTGPLNYLELDLSSIDVALRSTGHFFWSNGFRLISFLLMVILVRVTLRGWGFTRKISARSGWNWAAVGLTRLALVGVTLVASGVVPGSGVLD
jgi:hypothetical protein